MRGKTILVKVVALLLIFLGLYYILFLAPKIALPNAFLESQAVFAEHRTNLVQNRIALVELARLSPNSADIFNKEAELLKKLQATNEQGIKLLEENKELPSVAGVGNGFLYFLNNDLPVTLQSLRLKERQILEEQQSLIASLIDLIQQSATAPKAEVLSTQFALIRSDSSVKLLTRQSNLILEYDFWLKKISDYQAKLSIAK